MPATQHDAVLWFSGSAYDVIFDEARQAISTLVGLATVAEETSSWPYRHHRDLTGFIDGTENLSLLEAPGVIVVPEGTPGAGGTILVLQKRVHDWSGWESLEVSAQERMIGRRKEDSAELDPKPPESHVARIDQEVVFGRIFRRNMPYGTVTNHGTVFVGFSAATPHRDAGQHGRSSRWRSGCLDPVHDSIDRRILLHSFSRSALPIPDRATDRLRRSGGAPRTDTARGPVKPEEIGARRRFPRPMRITR